MFNRSHVLNFLPFPIWPLSITYCPLHVPDLRLRLMSDTRTDHSICLMIESCRWEGKVGRVDSHKIWPPRPWHDPTASHLVEGNGREVKKGVIDPNERQRRKTLKQGPWAASTLSSAGHFLTNLCVAIIMFYLLVKLTAIEIHTSPLQSNFWLHVRLLFPS